MRALVALFIFVLAASFVEGAAEATIPTNGLVLYYSLNGNALDGTAQQNDGTANGATPMNDRFGQATSAYHLNGTGNYIQAKASLPESQSITVSLWFELESWVQRNDWTAPQVIFFEGDDGPGHDVACYVMGGLHFVVKSDQAVHYNSWLPPLLTWTHLVCVADNQTHEMSIWVNGERVATAAFSTGANEGFHAPFNLGRRPGVYNDWFMAGGIDEVRVYNRALQPDEITNLYSLEEGFSKSVEVAVETLRVTMHLVPGRRYILQSSPDLEAWTDFGTAFVAELAEEFVSVEVSERRKFWRVVESAQ